ncbi:hypothetical protein, partial [Clostridium sp. AF02-29]|uniref:hypothetical protein n=1 Tax=Clostridium sp. AF02-29 TaxID=2292993 RepID=UPI0023557606
MIFADVRELSSAPRGGGWRKKVSWSLLSSPQCTSSKKLRFSSLSGIRPMKKRSHTQPLLCKHNASVCGFFLVRSAPARKNFVFPR